MDNNRRMQELEDRIYGPSRDEPGFRKYWEDRGVEVEGPCADDDAPKYQLMETRRGWTVVADLVRSVKYCDEGTRGRG